jgi:hypothetical protein
MTATCPHGFPAAECLICRTLQSPPQSKVETRPSGSGLVVGDPLAGAASVEPVRPVTPDQVYAPGNHQGRPRSLGLHLTLLVVGVAVIGLVAWVVAGAVFALLHIIELVLVAGVAGWAGYRLGHYRGRRHPRS